MKFLKIKYRIIVIFCVLSIGAQAGPIRNILQKHILQNNTEYGSKMTDVAYGKDKKQKFDVYLPNNPKDAPIIVMVHGGAWSLGDKSINRVVENKTARWLPKGVIFISVNYRLLPNADPLKQAEDVANALTYIQKHGALWGGDTKKIILMGHSSGAHLVTLISSDPTRYSILKPWLGTISLDSAVMNVPQIMNEKHYDFYDKAFGTDKEYWEDSSPYHRLKNSAIPMLMVCSTKRPDKPCIQAELFSIKAKMLKLRAEVSPQPLSHKEINENLGIESMYTQRVEDFICSLGIAL